MLNICCFPRGKRSPTGVWRVLGLGRRGGRVGLRRNRLDVNGRQRGLGRVAPREHPLDEVGREGKRSYGEDDAQNSVFGEDGWSLVFAYRLRVGAVGFFAAKGSRKGLRERLTQSDQPRCERAASV